VLRPTSDTEEGQVYRRSTVGLPRSTVGLPVYRSFCSSRQQRRHGLGQVAVAGDLRSAKWVAGGIGGDTRHPTRRQCGEDKLPNYGSRGMREHHGLLTRHATRRKAHTLVSAAAQFAEQGVLDAH
jgi:hypothetical protein